MGGNLELARMGTLQVEDFLLHDLDDDGFLDLVTLSESPHMLGTRSRVVWFAGSQNGFEEMAGLESAGAPQSLRSADIDANGFDDLICNRLVYEDGVASGEVVSPLLAEQEKVAAVHRFCREYNVETARSKAYSDSFSDLPMLEAVGLPSAVNPDRRLRRTANDRSWPVLNL